MPAGGMSGDSAVDITVAGCCALSVGADDPDSDTGAQGECSTNVEDV